MLVIYLLLFNSFTITKAAKTKTKNDTSELIVAQKAAEVKTLQSTDFSSPINQDS